MNVRKSLKKLLKCLNYHLPHLFFRGTNPRGQMNLNESYFNDALRPFGRRIPLEIAAVSFMYLPRT